MIGNLRKTWYMIIYGYKSYIKLYVNICHVYFTQNRNAENITRVYFMKRGK
jgi:hypothetical protein